tara:strand:+ start:673 stop:2982 length:2310 start_codon:yes stop_codon:yes gene_type:complete
MMMRSIVALTFGIVISINSGSAHAANLQKKSVQLLVVHSYSQNYPWTEGQHNGFANTLKEILKFPFELKTEYLDTKRKSLNDKYSKNFVDFLRAKYEAYSPHAIYVTDDDSLNFAVNQLSKLFPDVPIFFSGVNDYSQLSRINKSAVTGVFEKKEIGPNIELLRRLIGEFHQIAVIGDGSPTYRAIEIELKKELRADDNLQVTYIVGGRIQVILDALARLPKQPVILTTLGAVRNDVGDVLSLKETISKIVQTDHKIVVSMEDVYLFDGVVGGFVTSSIAQGSAAARLLNAYLSGRPIADLAAITQSPNEYVLNDRMLEALQVELPAKIADIARLINMRPNYYDKYRQYVIGTIIILSIALAVTFVMYVVTLTLKNRQLVSTSYRLTEQGNRLKESELLLRRERKLLDDVGRMAKTGGWELDLLTMNLKWSAETYRIHEVPDTYEPNVEEAINFYAPKDRPIITAAVEAGMENGTPWDLELSLVTAKGRPLWVRAIGEVIFEDEKPVILLGTFQDITHGKMAEEQSRLHHEQLAHVTRVATMGEMATGIAHELNQPLAAIAAYIDGSLRHLESGDQPSKSIIEALKKASKQAIRAGDVIRHLRDFVRREDRKSEYLNINDAVKMAVQLMKAELDLNQIILTLDLAQKSPVVIGDPILIQQVILNLVRNSVDAMKSVNPQSGELSINTSIEDGIISIAIKDSGPGIEAIHQKQIFDPYFSTKKYGLGLGLPMCRSIINELDGKIWYEPAPKQGAVFHIQLPMLKEDSAFS